MADSAVDEQAVRVIATAICKSRSCEGFRCCQWPAQGGRLDCPVRNGGYDDAGRDALAAYLAHVQATMKEIVMDGEGVVIEEPKARN